MSTTPRKLLIFPFLLLFVASLALVGNGKGTCDPEPDEPIGCTEDADCVEGEFGVCDVSSGECEYAVFGPADSEQQLVSRIRRFVGDDIERFQVYRMDIPSVMSRLDRGEAFTLPTSDRSGRPGTIDVRGIRVDNYAGELDAFITKGPSARRVNAALAPQYQLGCGPNDNYCGALTVLDGAATQIELALADSGAHLVFIESSESFLAYAEGRPATEVEPSTVLVYNAAQHAPLELATGDMQAFPVDLVFLDYMMVKTIPIVLDADQTFYNIDPATVWSRQASILNGMNLMYGWLEEITAGNLSIEFEIKGQETWLPGYGPTTTNPYDLTDEINDPNYYMITHPANDEVSLFYLGQDMTTGIIGMAGGVCNLPGYDTTFGSNQAHQDNHAWAQQVQDSNGSFDLSSFYARLIVSAHEVGHMLGMRHDHGDVAGCAGGTFTTWCGATIGLAGGGGQPVDRVPFFSTQNRNNIATCVDDTLNP